MIDALDNLLLLLLLFSFLQLLVSNISHLNKQAIASQLGSNDEKILTVSINSLSKVRPSEFFS